MKKNFERLGKNMRRTYRDRYKSYESRFRQINCIHKSSKMGATGKNRKHGRRCREIISRSSLITCCLASISLINEERGDWTTALTTCRADVPLIGPYYWLCDCMLFTRTRACMLTLKARKTFFPDVSLVKSREYDRMRRTRE